MARLALFVVGVTGLASLALSGLAAVAWPLVIFGMFGPPNGYWSWVLRGLVIGGLLVGTAATGLLLLPGGWLGSADRRRPGDAS